MAHHKAESILEQDFADLAESAEEPLQVALSNTVAEVADVDPGHVFGLLAAEPASRRKTRRRSFQRYYALPAQSRRAEARGNGKYRRETLNCPSAI